MSVGSEFGTLDWLAARLPLNLAERATSTENQGGKVKVVEIMEARVDGYLCRRDSPFAKKFNDDPLAICEAKPFTRESGLASIRRQEGAEMACWISRAGDSRTGLLRSSSSGRKRRLMVNQDRHEITVVVGEYGPGFEDHVRQSTEPKPDRTRSSSNTNSNRVISSSGKSKPDANVADLNLLFGSPTHIRQVETKRIRVVGPQKMLQMTRAASRMQLRPMPEWAPDAGDFLIMHEFGPFLITEPSDMEVLIRRLIAFMLQLRGPQERFVAVPPTPAFLLQPAQGGIRTPDAPSSRRQGPLRKARSFPGRTERSTEGWEIFSPKPKWDTANRR